MVVGGASSTQLKIRFFFLSSKVYISMRLTTAHHTYTSRANKRSNYGFTEFNPYMHMCLETPLVFEKEMELLAVDMDRHEVPNLCVDKTSPPRACSTFIQNDIYFSFISHSVTMLTSSIKGESLKSENK
jgi:hypothetical protein